MKYRLLMAAALFVPAFVHAQPREAAPDHYGDRQTGTFGDPNKGQFGNPAEGNFDTSAVKAPPAGAVPMGKVYRREAEKTAPYVSLSQPVDAAAPAPAPVAKTPVVAATPKKKHSAKKAKR